MGDFYGTGIEICAGFGPVGITGKKKIWADYEQLFRLLFYVFMGKKGFFFLNIVASALKAA